MLQLLPLLVLLAAGAPASDRPPVILELFTSQGCSSCPPADRLLSRLAAGPEGGRVVPLAFHVDYWNHLGWRDPFSARAWSERQQRYARAFGSGRIYTPQLVLDGGRDCVGSQEQVVRRELARALAHDPAGRVALRSVRLEPGRLRVAVEARLGRAVPRPLDLLVVVTESGLVTPVGRGENARHTLANDFVVRRLERAATLAAAPAPRRTAFVALSLAPDWKREGLRVAAFLQDPVTLRIEGAAGGPVTSR